MHVPAGQRGDSGGVQGVRGTLVSGMGRGEGRGEEGREGEGRGEERRGEKEGRGGKRVGEKGEGEVGQGMHEVDAIP